MGATGIEWTQGPNGEQGYSFSPWIGCTQVSPACDNCYAKDVAENKMGIKWDGPVHPVAVSAWKAIAALDRRAGRLACRFRVFPSMCDPLDKMAPHTVRDRFWRLVEDTPNLDWMILTKRPQLAERYMPPKWFTGSWPRNAWFGVTAENQAEAERRIPPILRFPAPLLFLSCEPLLGDLNLRKLMPDGINFTLDALTGRGEHLLGMRGQTGKIGWVIAGGESGKIANCRPTPTGAFEFLAEQCRETDTPFFMKQLDQVSERGSVVVGERDGKLIRKPAYKHFDSFPPALRVRQQPRISL